MRMEVGGMKEGAGGDGIALGGGMLGGRMAMAMEMGGYRREDKIGVSPAWFAPEILDEGKWFGSR